MIRDLDVFSRGGKEGGGAGYLFVECSICVDYTLLHIWGNFRLLVLPDETYDDFTFRSNLAPVILQLKALGIDNVLRFNFLTPPPVEMMIRSLEVSWARETIHYHNIVLLIGSNEL